MHEHCHGVAVAWTIDELIRECGRVLVDEPQPSGRVTDIPDLRTVRYYAALGLLDPPSGFDKKKGLYDEHHLQQLLAIKRLQRDGLALAEIQKKLAGVSGAKLKTIADPAAFWKRKPPPPATVEAFRIAPGVTLLLEGVARPFTEEDARALRAWLHQRGLEEET
jgi:DNA-binding transcriptional MerR regulator